MAKNMKFMNAVELRALAAKKGIVVPGGAVASQIRALIKESESAQEPESPPDAKAIPYDKKLATEPRLWVRVFNRDLSEGMDFGFTFEGHRYHLINGEVVRLPQSVIEHLKGIHYPQPKLKQGEAGQAVKTEGSYHRFAVTNVDTPEPVGAPA